MRGEPFTHRPAIAPTDVLPLLKRAQRFHGGAAWLSPPNYSRIEQQFELGLSGGDGTVLLA
jgi:hypothetical protein